MSQIWITGDTHGDFRRFSSENFPEQKGMSKEDYMIIAGDFGGIWTFKPLPGINDGYEVFIRDQRAYEKDLKTENMLLDWLNDKPFTFLFVPGNHENYDRLYSDEFPTVDYMGGKAKKIRDSIFMLMNGYVYSIAGKKIWTFGGASSHDVENGIMDLKDYASPEAMRKVARIRSRNPEDMFRINHYTWWKEEIPDQAAMDLGMKGLKEHGNAVDLIVTHCAPQEIVDELSGGHYKADPLTLYFDSIMNDIRYGSWVFGHYHDNERVSENHFLLYEQMVRVV